MCQRDHLPDSLLPLRRSCLLYCRRVRLARIRNGAVRVPAMRPVWLGQLTWKFWIRYLSIASMAYDSSTSLGKHRLESVSLLNDSVSRWSAARAVSGIASVYIYFPAESDGGALQAFLSCLYLYLQCDDFISLFTFCSRVVAQSMCLPLNAYGGSIAATPVGKVVRKLKFAGPWAWCGKSGLSSNDLIDRYTWAVFRRSSMAAHICSSLSDV